MDQQNEVIDNTVEKFIESNLNLGYSGSIKV